MELPLPFIEELSAALPEKKAAEVISAISGTPTVAVRLNPLKLTDIRMTGLPVQEGDAGRTYSKNGYFLSSRPEFAADPLFHAGAYYVQEASSMYLESISERIYAMADMRNDGIFAVLDLCASPGGKSTHLLSMLSAISGSVLVSNEVIRSRVGALCENVSKWGYSNAIVTSQDPSEFGKLGPCFDVAVVDAPCSGEGMFRKDPEAVRQWSPENVDICAARQKRILEDVLPSLKPGGLLVYSTCTFNRKEDEGTVDFLISSEGMELLDMKHFYPGEQMAGEGFFFALLRKGGEYEAGTAGTGGRRRTRNSGNTCSVPFVKDGFSMVRKGSKAWAMPAVSAEWMAEMELRLKAVQSGCMVASLVSGAGGKILQIPEHALVQGETYSRGYFPEKEISRETALDYISRGQIVLQDMPSGYILLTYKGIPLGLVKNLGRRCNNLWPENLRLRKKF